MYADLSPAVWWSEWIHVLRHARTFSCRRRKQSYGLSFSPFISFHSSRQITTVLPEASFWFHTLSRHFPSFRLPALTPFPPFLLILFLLLFSSALGESALAFLLRPLSLPPSVLYVRLCHHLCVSNQMKLLLSADTHMHAVSCPCWGILITAPPSLPPSTDPCLSPVLLLLLALSLLLLLSSLLWLWVFFIKIHPEKNGFSIHKFGHAD